MTELSTLSPAERHRAVAATFAGVADAITDWDAQTPVPEWKAGEVVGHLVEWLPGFLAMTGVELPGAPSDAAVPAAAFGQLTEAVQALLDAPDASRIVTTQMFGDRPLDGLIDQFYTADVFMHTWDLARSNGITPDLDPAFAKTLHGGLESMGPMLQQSGQFGAPIPVPDGTDEATALMAFIGRDPAFGA
ncbi:maleylpyruvate isomerase N-terminal domain-containing protein [Tsukamurella spumae]|uniref:TIGR03086 family protein n=1 Tax=Tsukamurella spumae TaxID=44753 RepID=A0A846X0R9_9ACTN|nr:maleylpyruvate isomerase N-terminal domain-containing protein [Tsukamurella spumae]NKY18701.1 TIGR03086 family protein [Tsukamurella spumae]